MGGKGELVNYNRLFERGRQREGHPPEPLTPQQKADLKDKVCRLIESATFEITVETMIFSPPKSPPHT